MDREEISDAPGVVPQCMNCNFASLDRAFCLAHGLASKEIEGAATK